MTDNVPDEAPERIGTAIGVVVVLGAYCILAWAVIRPLVV